MTDLLKGGTAIIIGAASGIGRASAIAFAAEGCTALALGDINLPGLEETCSIIIKSRPNSVVEGYQLDVGDEASVESFHSKAVSKLGRIDFVVNNAGYGHPAAPITTLSEKEWYLSYLVNQKGTVPMNNYAAYSASKGGVLGVSKCDAFDYGPDGIRINCIAPGNTTTPILIEAAGDAGLKALAAATPLRRNATPEDVANSVVWLSSSKASFITGTTLTVDGGYNLRTPSF